MLKLTNIQLAGNEHGQLRADTLYAQLVDEQGHIVISATLDYILAAIRDRRYEVEGVSVEWKGQRGVYCSTVSLDKYGA